MAFQDKEGRWHTGKWFCAGRYEYEYLYLGDEYGNDGFSRSALDQYVMDEETKTTADEILSSSSCDGLTNKQRAEQDREFLELINKVKFQQVINGLGYMATLESVYP